MHFSFVHDQTCILYCAGKSIMQEFWKTLNMSNILYPGKHVNSLWIKNTVILAVSFYCTWMFSFQSFFTNIFDLSWFSLHNDKIGWIGSSHYNFKSYRTPMKVAFKTLFDGITLFLVVLQILASEGDKLQFLWHAALPKACASG